MSLGIDIEPLDSEWTVPTHDMDVAAPTVEPDTHIEVEVFLGRVLRDCQRISVFNDSGTVFAQDRAEKYA